MGHNRPRSRSGCEQSGGILKTHELKTLPDYFSALWSGAKRFELRNNDRGFAIGDWLVLREWSVRDGYSRRARRAAVTYILEGTNLLPDQMCILSLELGEKILSYRPAGLIGHPLWRRMRDYLVIEEYARDGGHEDPRVRLEFKGVPPALASEALSIKVPCVSCSKPIAPIRRRKGSTLSSLYYACACSLEANTACSRTRAAADDYRRLRGEPVQPSKQRELF